MIRKLEKLILTVAVWSLLEFPAYADFGDLKDKLGKGLGVMMIFGFFWGIIKIWSGANAIAKGDPEGKMSIVGGIIIAGATGIMTLLFKIFGMGDATLTPSF